ncbi:MAG: B12-binding domain-containing radical SAM protein [Myxococcota bacterium]
MRALILNPPSSSAVFRDHYCASEAKSAYLWHPLDLLIQAACLREAGWELTALDAVATRMSLLEVLRDVDPAQFDLAVVLVSERTWSSDVQVLRHLRSAGRIRIAASGDFLRFGSGPMEEARPLVDWILTDFTTPHLPKTFDTGAPVGLGIATPEAVMAGAFADMGRAPLDYPTPDLNLFGTDLYRLPYPGFTRFASVLSGYGCPYHCLYCHVGELGYRLRPVDAIIAELSRARQQGARQVYFRDATINARRKHLLTWTRAMVDAGLDMPWAAFATAAPLDDEMAAAMRASGCEHLQIGVETLDEALRTKNGKPFDDAAHHAFVATCHAHDIEVTAHLVLGLPGETEATMARTVDGLVDAGFDYVAVNLAEDRPGIPWRKQDVGLVVKPTGGEGAHTDGPNLAELKRWQSLAYRRFYLRPRRLAQEAVSRLENRDFGDALGLMKDVARWWSA